MLNFVRAGAVCAAAALIVGSTTPVQALTFTCEGIARKGFPDPDGAAYAGRFGHARRGGPAINGAGDVTFFAVPKRAPRRLYLYPGAGGGSVIAEQGQVAPGGGAFTNFESPSINDAGDVAFFGDLAVGEGVFVRQAGGTLLKVAQSGDAAPGGGAFDDFTTVSRINTAGDVAFVATIDGGTSPGAFVWDAGTATLASVVRAGDAALDGRQLCDFLAIGLGATRAAVHASTKVVCANAEPEVVGIYQDTGAGFARVALEGDATPIGSTTYAAFYGPPDSNATDAVLFRASAAGTPSVTGLFVYDPAGPTTVAPAATGDGAPGGGSLRTITTPGLTDDGRAGFRARIDDAAARDGIFVFGPPHDVVVLGTDPVPSNLFVPGSTYRKLYEEIGVDRTGTRVTYSAIVKDASGGTKVALFRCAGS